MLVDSHCHLDRLDLTPFSGDFSLFLDRIEAAGVERMLCVAINLGELETMRSLVEQSPRIDMSVGVHPNEVVPDEPSTTQLADLAEDSAVVAIGETGLDYHWDDCPIGTQQERFRRHIRAAKQAGKPLIIHCRDAADDTLRILREEDAGQVGGVFHCFTGDWQEARQALDQNFHVSFSGIVTFKSALSVQEVAAKVPSDRYLIETDAPYLAPAPFRGKPNYPFHVGHVAEFVAGLRGVSRSVVEEETASNYYRLFSSSARLSDTATTAG
jgi:TatD DNase family protein